MNRSSGLTLAFTAFAALTGASAHAADLPVFKAPPIAVADTWTGFYLGGHGGYGWGNKTFLDNFPTPDLALDAERTVVGGLGGLQGGYNYQFNWLVVGVDGDFSWSGVKDGSFPCFSFGHQFCSAHPEWFATATGRVGAAVGPVLIYGKGGAAWVNDSFTDIATTNGSSGGISAVPGDLFTANRVRMGWTVGGGIEYEFARNWSIWAEYDYMQFGGRSVPFTDGGNGFFTEEIHQNMNVVKVGLNYRFDLEAPVAAPLPVNKSGDDSADAGNESANRVIAFSGVDVYKFTEDAWAGGMIAPYKDLDTSGLRVYILADGSSYKYFGDSGTAFKGVSETGDFLAGYGFEGDNYSINLLAGLNAENDTLSAFDPENKVVGTEFGGMVRGDAWVNPTDKTLIYTEGEFSSAFLTYYTKGQAGYDVTNGNAIFVGPEVATLGNERFAQLRVGAHVTQIKFGKVQVDLSAGYANDSSVGPGAYGTVELSTNF